jgi:hypothetical protein
MTDFKRWIQKAGVRALKTVAQTAVATVGTMNLITEVNWYVVVSASALAGVLSLLTSLAGLPELEEEDDTKHAKHFEED